MREKLVLSLSYGRIIRRNMEGFKGLLPESFEGYQILEPGNVVMRTTDMQNDRTSLRFGYVTERGIITSAYMTLEAKGDLRADYMYRYLHALDSKKVFYGMGDGLRQSVDFSDLKRLPFPLPPSHEQKHIVRFLDSFDAKTDRLIQAKQQLIALLNEQKQAIIQRAVTRGLDPDVPLRASGVDWLGNVPEHWGLVSFRRLVSTVTSGSRGWAQYYSDEGDLFIQSGNLGRSMGLDLSRVQHVRLPGTVEGKRTLVKRDDILVCITGALTGNAVVVDQDLPVAYINQHVALARPREGAAIPRFLGYVLHSPIGQSQFHLSQYGGTKQGLGLDDVKSVLVPLPPQGEQEAIINLLDDELREADEVIRSVEREITLIREYRQRLVADVVTGKLDVRGVEVPNFPPEASGVEVDEVVDGGATFGEALSNA